jgi:hypothetical protein
MLDRPEGEGWVPFGCHSCGSKCAYPERLEFGPDNPDDGLPDWERHADGSECSFA